MEFKERNDREKCYAKVIFKEDNLPGYVRDISKSGCRIDVIHKIAWEQGERKKIVIIPEEEVGFAPVHGTIEIRWVKKQDLFWALGTRLVSVQDEGAKENYRLLLDYFETKRTL